MQSPKKEEVQLRETNFTLSHLSWNTFHFSRSHVGNDFIAFHLLITNLDAYVDNQVITWLRLQLHGAIYRPQFFCIDAASLCEFESNKT